MKIPALQGIKRGFLADFGIPEEALENAELRTRFDARDTQRALAGSGIELPPLDSYADKLWDYWERNLDPDLFKDRSFEGAVNGRTVVITGASSGIGRAAALKIAAAGGIPLLVARTRGEARGGQGRDRGRGRRRVRVPVRPLRLRRDRGARPADARRPPGDRHARQQRRPLDPALGQALLRPLPRLRADHRLNYLGPVKLMLGLLPHMGERGSGHIVNVSSIGVQTNPPRFSAYVASKAALDAWTRVVSSETIGDNVTFTTIHMPLVRTPMIAPTKIYDSFPTISPDEAADLICEAIRAKPKQINTRLGHVRRGRLRAGAEGRRPDPAHGLQGVPRVGRGERQEGPERAGLRRGEALAYLMRGVHW